MLNFEKITESLPAVVAERFKALFQIQAGIHLKTQVRIQLRIDWQIKTPTEKVHYKSKHA